MRLSTTMTPWMMTLLLATSCTSSAPHTQPASSTSLPSLTPMPEHANAWWRHWSDGQAEVSGYRLVRERYGQKRSGTAVAIFVTEPFSTARMVKANDAAAADVVQAMKLNLVERFQTGVYDYHLMSTTHVALQSRASVVIGQPLKVAFSSQEWCGLSHHELVWRAQAVDERVDSYFDGESHAGSHAWQQALPADALWLWARGMAAPATGTATLLPSLTRARLQHITLEPVAAELARLPEEDIRVAAGTFRVQPHRVTTPQGSHTMWVETAAPHRIIRAEHDGTTYELLGSTRMTYWSMNQPGMEQALARIGVPAPALSNGSP
jgi:hypothetical protein